MKNNKTLFQYHFVILLTILAVITVIFCYTGIWPWNGNTYNSYSIQAQSWLEGRLDVGENRPWLELAIYRGQFFVSFPPFPSFLLLPFVLIFGEATPDHFITIAVTLLGAVYAAKLYKETTGGVRNVVFYVLFLYLASGFLMIGINGSVWFIAQNICFTLSLMSIYYALRTKGTLSLFLWACAVGCRPITAVFLPVLLIALWHGVFKGEKDSEKKGFFGKAFYILKTKWYWLTGPVVMAGIYMSLNYARFGNVFEFGHNYLPEFVNAEHGQFSINYLADNLRKLFSIPGVREENGTVAFPTFDGFAFYIASPMIIMFFAVWGYELFQKIRSCRYSSRVTSMDITSVANYTVHRIRTKGLSQCVSLIVLIPVLFIMHTLLICMHRTLGGWGFGNRYLLDSLPFLFWGIAMWKPRSDFYDRCMLPIMMFGFSLNLVGVIATFNGWI
ncbi:MAG: hypothetical protein J5819_07110 [Eubacterium sp.]|nr:hypothetical protein [Eubacterium sp.]